MTRTMEGFKLDDDSSEEDIDAIPEEMRAYRATRIDKKRKAVVDWREEGLGFCAAFFQGKMRAKDYVMMWSLIFLTALILIYGAAAAATTDKSVGLMIAFAILHVVLLVISMLGNIIANRQQEVWERGLAIFSFVMIYVAGTVFLFISYETENLNKDDDELPNELDRKDRDDARNYLISELILLPMITCFMAFGAKAYRDNTNGRAMTTGFWMLMILNFLQGIALTICVFLYGSTGFAWGFVFILTLAFYGFFQYVMTVRYSNRPIKISEKVSISAYTQKKVWNWMNITIAAIVFIGAVAFASSDDTTSDFAAVTMVIGIVMLMLGFLVLATWVKDRTQMGDMPIYHSPFIFPIYKYYPKENDIEPYSSAVVSFYVWIAIAMFWCFAATVEVSPSWVGVALTCAL